MPRGLASSLPGGRGPRSPQDAAEWYGQRERAIPDAVILAVSNHQPGAYQTPYTAYAAHDSSYVYYGFTPPISGPCTLTHARIYCVTAEAGIKVDTAMYVYDPLEKTLRILPSSDARLTLDSTGVVEVELREEVELSPRYLYAIAGRVDTTASGILAMHNMQYNPIRFRYSSNGSAASPFEPKVIYTGLSTTQSAPYITYITKLGSEVF